MVDLARTKFSSLQYCDFIYKAPDKGGRLFLFLHGYMQKAYTIYNKFESLIKPGDGILAPNGAYPIPVKVKDNWKHGYSWYFYNPNTREYPIDTDVAVSFIKTLLNEKNLNEHKITAIGFSQGGYLTPYLAQNIPQIDHIIGMACEFKTNRLDEGKRFDFRADQVHGGCDDLVNIEHAKETHRAILKLGARGSFIEFPEEKHEYCDVFISKVVEFMQLTD